VTPRLRCTAAVAAALAPALVACGSDTGSGDEAKPVGQRLVKSVAPMATCSDWKRGSRAERVATIHDIRRQINLRDGTVRTKPLSDGVAYRIIDTTCSRGFAGSLRLYKLYARADSFAAYAEQ
jgi:hypothetical protein